MITDLKMEGADGIQVLMGTRAASAGTRVIIITGFATCEIARESRRQGAVEFIVKPFKISDIAACVQRLAEERNQGKGLQPSTP